MKKFKRYAYLIFGLLFAYVGANTIERSRLHRGWVNLIFGAILLLYAYRYRNKEKEQ